MEGFAVLRAAELAGVPAIEIRVVSNDPSDVDRSVWRIDEALSVVHQTIRAVGPALLEVCAGGNHAGRSRGIG
jgi:futalosine hydrolase